MGTDGIFTLTVWGVIIGGFVLYWLGRMANNAHRERIGRLNYELRRRRKEAERAARARASGRRLSRTHTERATLWSRRWREQEGACAICNKPIPEEYDGQVCHLDHNVPLVLDGPEITENLQATHAYCNLSKGGRGMRPHNVQWEKLALQALTDHETYVRYFRELGWRLEAYTAEPYGAVLVRPRGRGAAIEVLIRRALRKPLAPRLFLSVDPPGGVQMDAVWDELAQGDRPARIRFGKRSAVPSGRTTHRVCDFARWPRSTR